MNKLGRNDLCWCQSGIKYKKCHADFDYRLEDYRHRGAIVPSHDIIKTPTQIQGIRESARINIAVLDYVSDHIKAGIATNTTISGISYFINEVIHCIRFRRKGITWVLSLRIY